MKNYSFILQIYFDSILVLERDFVDQRKISEFCMILHDLIISKNKNKETINQSLKKRDILIQNSKTKKIQKSNLFDICHDSNHKYYFDWPDKDLISFSIFDQSII